ncbi:sensor histidine kinase [Acidihalobacter prosperus]|uniref:histidine kinase n=1 Tax=Acidihalobacter prosperus TaxID=160660 RepID=A0A1A6C5J1_9GAMM|nr:ATP-binding protein [Acidihalobacter prosperus]OBS09828.1 Flagellar sensor histidine kinase FleS [Acidihalobacter prosperus]
MNPTDQAISGQATDGEPSAQASERERLLAEAFDAFNRLSEDLAFSYRGLEQRVEQLSRELAAARSERLVQLAEKERLANRLGRLLELLPGAVIVTGEDGMVREANPAAHEFLGEPLIGQRWPEVAMRFVSGPAGAGEVRLDDGRRLNVSVRSLGSEPGDILLLQDVTDTRTLQEQLDHHRRLAAMGEMVAGLAHQIRTPLSSVLLYLAHLEPRRIEEEQRLRVVGKIRAQVQHLERMVNDMLQFARGGANNLTPLTLGAIVDEFREMVNLPLAEHGGTLAIDWEAGLADRCCMGQREGLVGALLNLASNAMQSADRGVHLDLRIWQPRGEHVAMTMRDSGPGVPQAIADRIFEPFYTTHHQGTGLGLAVVRAILEAHGGEVTLDRSGQPGGAFTLHLPLVPCDATDNDNGA